MKVKEIVQQEILKRLDEGTIPWKQNWVGSAPTNLISKKEYTGFNHMWLTCQCKSSPFWLTFNQIKKKGGKIIKGEKSTFIIFYKEITKEDEEGEEYSYRCLRYYNVWNLDQITGIEEPNTEKFINNPIEECEKVIGNYKDKPTIKNGNPAYIHSSDIVTIPDLSKFKSAPDYYDTLFYELVHSTMHEKRLNRKICYAKEELVAEIGASYFCNKTGIGNSVIENQAAYIKSWSKKIKDDANLILNVASMAQKAVDYIGDKR